MYFLNYVFSRDEDSMKSVTQHRTRTLSVTSTGSILSCSTIPPVSFTCIPAVWASALWRVVNLGIVKVSGHLDIWILYINAVKLTALRSLAREARVHFYLEQAVSKDRTT